MANRFVNPVPQQSNSAGDPLLDAEYNFYTDETLTTRKDTFADANETIVNPNPLPLDGDGRTPNIFYDGTATVQLTNDDGSGQQQVWRADGVGAFGSGSAFDVWNPIIEYEKDALVQASDGEYYRSLQNNNIANDPTSSPTFWELIEFLRTWNASVTYAATNTAKGSDGLIYRSLAGANLNNNPTSTTGFWGAPIEFRVEDDLYLIDSELTISSGSVVATKSHHTIDTEADAATDDLDTITVAGVNDGTILMLRLEDAARVVTLKHNTGNIQLKQGLDVVMDAAFPTFLMRIGTDWQEIERPNNDTKPLFFASNSVTDSQATGDGTVKTLDLDTVLYDQGGNFSGTTFTAPVTGKYRFTASTRLTDVGAGHTLGTMNLVTTDVTLTHVHLNPANARASDNKLCLSLGIEIEMDAGDTATVTVTISNSTKVVDIEGSASAFVTYFSGELLEQIG